MEFKHSAGLVPYEEAIAFMEERVAAIHAGMAPECVWFLEHPPLYTAGTSAKADDLLDARFPVYETGRGGEHTYHGPGQRVVYVMLDLKKRQQSPDIKKYIWQLEEWIICTLAQFDIAGERREGRVGIWVTDTPNRRDDQQSGAAATFKNSPPFAGGHGGEKKIAAIGVRIRHWITFHGIAINVNPDLSHFGGIIPCGIKEFGVTSLHDLGKPIAMTDLDAALQQEFKAIF